MKDETYVFISDVKEKKVTARSAKHMRTHCGKGGRVRLPSDNLSKKELMKMNGECKSYRLNDPMAWNEFKAMPDDIKITYIKLLRQKFNVPFQDIGKMLGVCQKTISEEIIRLGLSEGKAKKGRPKKWDKEGFYAWWHGVKVLPEPVPEEPAEDSVEVPVIEEIPVTKTEPVHFYTEEEVEAVRGLGEVKVYVEDDLPFEEPDLVPVEKYRVQDAEIAVLNQRIEQLMKSIEELTNQHECDRQVIDKLRFVCSEYEEKTKLLEAQMDVVRLIFGGKNNG